MYAISLMRCRTCKGALRRVAVHAAQVQLRGLRSTGSHNLQAACGQGSDVCHGHTSEQAQLRRGRGLRCSSGAVVCKASPAQQACSPAVALLRATDLPLLAWRTPALALSVALKKVAARRKHAWAPARMSHHSGRL